MKTVTLETIYRGADKSLVRPRRKQGNVSFRMAWISFGALPCRKRTKWQLASRYCWNRARPWHASELVSFLVGLRTYQHPGTLLHNVTNKRVYKTEASKCTSIIIDGTFPALLYLIRYCCINLIVPPCIFFVESLQFIKPKNAHIISHKTLLKHSKTLRHVSILSDHHQGALFPAKVML